MTINSVSLEELCESITDCPHSTPKWTDHGYVVIRNYNIKNGRLDLSDVSYTDEKTFMERNKRNKPEAGDLIITREAPMGEVCIVPQGLECCLGQRMVLLKPDYSKCENRYLLYVLLSSYMQKQIKRSEGTGSIVSNLNIPDLKALPIPIKGMEIQKKISDVLTCLDKKIELNNKINEELENLAKTIYEYYFVQFEFPNEEGKPYKSSDGKMIWDEELKREIPEEWEVKRLGDIFDFVKGKIPKEIMNECVENSQVYLTIDVLNNGIPTYAVSEGNVITNSEVLMVMDGAASGTVYQGFDGIVASTLSKIKIKYNKVSNELLYYILKNIEDEIRKRNTGSTVPHANKDWINNYKICISDKVLKSTNEKIIEIRITIKQLEKQNQELIQLRDWLLPMLMNGQVTFENQEDIKDEAFYVEYVAETLAKYEE